jgi:hypothetical protein
LETIHEPYRKSLSSLFRRGPHHLGNNRPVTNCAGTCAPRSSSVGLTNSSPSSSGPVADKLVGSSRATEKIVWGLSLKTAQNDTIYMKHFVGGGGEAGDVQPGRRSAPNQPRNGLPWGVPHCRYPVAWESYRDRIEDAPMPVACPTRPSDLGILTDISGTKTIYIML